MSFVQIIQVLEVLQNIVYNFWTSMSFLTKTKHKMKSLTKKGLVTKLSHQYFPKESWWTPFEQQSPIQGKEGFPFD